MNESQQGTGIWDDDASQFVEQKYFPNSHG